MIKWLKKFFKIATVDKVDKTYPLEVNFNEGDTLLLNYPPNTSMEQMAQVNNFLRTEFDEYDKNKNKAILIPANIKVVGVIRRNQNHSKIQEDTDDRERDH